MCTLRNLSYRTQEVDDPNYDQVPAAGQQLEAALPILLLLLSLPFLLFFLSFFCPSRLLYFASCYSVPLSSHSSFLCSVPPIHYILLPS